MDMGFELQMNFICKKTDTKINECKIIMTSATFDDMLKKIALD